LLSTVSNSLTQHSRIAGLIYESPGACGAVISRVDVAIVGSGPAGAATAVKLARQGVLVLLIDRSTARPTLGEGLPPAATPLFHELGLWERFLVDGHREAHGNRSAWGHSTFDDYDFIRSPYGMGWHLDRPHFDRMLRGAAADSGAQICDRTRVTACRRGERTPWILSLVCGTSQREVHADFVIDASGRARWMARAQNVQRRSYDRLIGVVGVFRPATASTDRDSVTVIEAVRDGWWYATLLPDDRLVVGYMTDSDVAKESGARTAERWTKLLAETEEIHARITGHDYGLEAPPRVVTADSSCLERVTGEGWCAVGDAAASYDPLSAQGITAALTAGIQAEHALSRANSGGLVEYEAWMHDIYARYLAQWLAYYDLEQRWPEAPFWQRRHVMLERLFSSP
jgi:flavin-dependent dehydrogenase